MGADEFRGTGFLGRNKRLFKVPRDWGRYEQLKAEWLYRHPQASPAEVQAAMHQIAKQCGV